MKLKKMMVTTLFMSGLLVGCGTKDTPQEDASISGEITVITNRTDNDKQFKEMETNFIKEYPEVTKVTFENIADYDATMMTRMNSGDYGDVLFIPFSMAGNRSDYPNYFEALGTTADMEADYLDVYEADYDGQVYGLPAALNSLGFIYNERVLKEAGITEAPTTLDAFIKDLESIKEKTDATPFATNYHAVAMWAGALTSFGGEQFKSATLDKGDAFAEGQPIREVMDLFYTLSSKGLIETDPMTTDPQTAFKELADGNVAMLMHGSQEVSTVQSMTEDPIAIMNFPVQTEGKTNLAIGAPDVIGINKHSKNIETSKAFVTFFLSDKSGYVKELNGMPNLKSDLSDDQKKTIDTSNVILTVAKETPEVNATYSAIADEVGVARLTDVLQQVINIGLYPDKNISYEDYVKQLSEQWQTAAKNHE